MNTLTNLLGRSLHFVRKNRGGKSLPVLFLFILASCGDPGPSEGDKALWKIEAEIQQAKDELEAKQRQNAFEAKMARLQARIDQYKNDKP